MGRDWVRLVLSGREGQTLPSRRNSSRTRLGTMSVTSFCLIISTTPTTGAGLLVRCRLLLRPFHLRPSHRRHPVNATIRQATKPAASTVKSAADPDIVWPRASSMTTSTMAARSARSSRSGAPARDGRRRLRPWTVTQPWTPRTRPPLLGKRADAFPTPPTAVHGTREKARRTTRACARERNQTILMPPTAWPLFKRSSVAAFERSVTASRVFSSS